MFSCDIAAGSLPPLFNVHRCKCTQIDGRGRVRASYSHSMSCRRGTKLIQFAATNSDVSISLGKTCDADFSRSSIIKILSFKKSDDSSWFAAIAHRAENEIFADSTTECPRVCITLAFSHSTLCRPKIDRRPALSPSSSLLSKPSTTRCQSALGADGAQWVNIKAMVAIANRTGYFPSWTPSIDEQNPGMCMCVRACVFLSSYLSKWRFSFHISWDIISSSRIGGSKEFVTLQR